MDTISEIQERHDAVKEIEKNLMELHQVFLDMAALVEAQGQQLNSIENNVRHAASFVSRGTQQLQEAREHQKNSRKWMCMAILLALILIVVILFPLFISLFPTLIHVLKWYLFFFSFNQNVLCYHRLMDHHVRTYLLIISKLTRVGYVGWHVCYCVNMLALFWSIFFLIYFLIDFQWFAFNGFSWDKIAILLIN